jgi:inosine-uridine nucleoside N-ribohydrolase
MSSYILDCDPGHDDAVALLFAAQHLKLLGVTTVFGNSTIQNTTHNALAILDAAKLNIPVARGSGAPLRGEIKSGESVHGKSGLDGASLPHPVSAPVNASGPEFIIEAARTRDDLHIMAVAPLTNLAKALTQAPDIISRIQEISIMGGSTGPGNATAAAEFNIFADPEAASIVYNSGVPLRMAGLNVTTSFGISNVDVDKLRHAGSSLAREIGGALHYYLNRQGVIYERQFAPIHDVCAVIPYTHPELLVYTEMHVDVECEGTLTRGQTVCDQRGLNDGEGLDVARPANTAVATDAEGDRIVNLVIDALMQYP